MSIERNFGLDVARSLAILLVLASHSIYFFFIYFGNINYLTVAGYLGVELFFVLSGYLIGNILLREVLRGAGLERLSIFLVRPWLRTLPAYYVVLTILSIIALVSGQQAYWQHFLFLQNFNERAASFFGASWSLALEEWFYLLVPLLVFWLISLFGISRLVLTVLLISGILAFPVARYIDVVTGNPTWDFGIRKQIFLRFDVFFFGIAMAYLTIFSARVVSFVRRYSGGLITLGAIIVMPVIFQYCMLEKQHLLDSSVFMRTFGFSLISLGCSFFILGLEQNQWLNTQMGKIRFIKFVVTWTSVLSYSLYLIHNDILVFFQMHPEWFGRPNMYSWLSALVLVFIVAILLYKFIESPFLRLRAHVYPESRKVAMAGVGYQLDGK